MRDLENGFYQISDCSLVSRFKTLSLWTGMFVVTKHSKQSRNGFQWTYKTLRTFLSFS